MNSNVADIVNSLRNDDSVEVHYIPGPYQEAARDLGAGRGMWRSIWVSARFMPQFEALIGKEFVQRRDTA